MSNYSLADDLQARELTSAEKTRRELESEEKELTADCRELERQADELTSDCRELEKQCSLLEQTKQQLTAEIERLKELLERAYKRGKQQIQNPQASLKYTRKQ